MQIAVLGGGNGAYAAAATLSEQGHAVRLWRRDATALEAAIAAGGLTLVDHAGERHVPLSLVTADIGEAVSGAALVIFPGPAFAQTDVAEAIAPILSDGQVVFLPPGTFGSYVMMRTIRDLGCTADVMFAETGTLPYLTRKHGNDRIAITRHATRLPTGVFPADKDAVARALIAQAYPAIEPCENVLSAALMNAGPIIHPPLIIMNAGPIEHFEHWDIHNEGTQHSIRRVTTALDGERIATREALGYRAPHFPLADHYASDGDEWMYGRAAHAKLTDSGDWREDLDLLTHRYMREDVALALSFLVSVANWAGVPCPVASALVALGGAVCREDFTQGPRTLPALGLASLTRGQMQSLLKDGI
jgi:opine dehydrogenase